ncbi:yrdC domain-containing protein mitochondrial-like, partial [Trifolium medium]|nr:yrdC domain-containing protein mitochondrial-like [Trifolium medium]
GFSKNMAWSMDSGDLGLEVNVGVVHPATDAYAAEAVEALKAGKVNRVCSTIFYIGGMKIIGNHRAMKSKKENN